MFYVLSKTVGLLADPVVLVALLSLLTLAALLLRRPRLALGASIVLVLAIGLFGFTTLGRVLLWPLETRFPVPAEPAEVAGIIVLGGGFADPVPGHPYGLNEAGDRLTEAVRLARRYPSALLVVTGGDGRLSATGASDGDLAPLLFADLGLVHERTLYENASRSTAENAAEVAALLEQTYAPGQRWLLVTSAFHMPRAVGVFRKAGFDVESWPVDYRAPSGGFALTGDDPAGRFDDVASALKEWVGLIAYNLAGYTTELFPGPE